MGSILGRTFWGAFAGLQTAPGEVIPLPASPPIGGVLWTVVVPSALFIGSLLGTYFLYRRFSREGE